MPFAIYWTQNFECDNVIVAEFVCGTDFECDNQYIFAVDIYGGATVSLSFQSNFK